MESKPHTTIQRTDAEESFNRTSMESKRYRCVERLETRLLLIEPVWNRNIDPRTAKIQSDVTFNRTSMESKQYIANAYLADLNF